MLLYFNVLYQVHEENNSEITCILRICCLSIEWPIPKWLYSYLQISGNANNIPWNNCAQFDKNGTFNFKVIAKKPILDGEFRISPRQSRKIRLAHFVGIKGEKHPLSPRGNVDPSHVTRSLSSTPNIDWWGVGKDIRKGPLLLSIKQCFVPKLVSIASTGMVVRSCVKCSN